MRTPLLSVVLPLVAIGLLGLGLATEQWAEYKQGEVEADVGVLRYKVTKFPGPPGTDGPSGWIFDIDCGKTSDSSKCKTFLRASVGVVAVTGLAALLLCFAWYHLTLGAGISVGGLFSSFIISAAGAVTFAATYNRMRLPLPPTPPSLDRRASLQGLVGVSEDMRPGDMETVFDITTYPDPDITLDWSFIVFSCSALISLVALFHHISTCSRRKFEEL
eukprot:Hpha_TRINITY_DN16152_c3_g6::TRINITY_DN16152_c3_g6_i1::g.6092::m.6092